MNDNIEKEIWSLFDEKKLIAGEVLNVDMFGETYDILIFMYRETPKDIPTVLFVEYGAMLVNTNEEAVSKYIERIYTELKKLGKIKGE